MLFKIDLNKFLTEGGGTKVSGRHVGHEMLETKRSKKEGDINTCAGTNTCAHLSAHTGMSQRKERKEVQKGANSGSTSKSFCLREQQ